MKTYTFISKNTSVIITLSADSELEAQEILNQLVEDDYNDFRLDEETEEE